MRLIHKKLISFLFVAFVIISILGIGVGGKAYADTSLSGYSNVLDDLQKDDSFTISEYPAIDDDYSLQVIQIAESTAGELFVYVYQPAANTRQLKATLINMALTEDFSVYDYDDSGSLVEGGGHGGGGGSIRSAENSTASTYLYDLTLINYSGVFAKYKVKGFAVSNDEIRYYNITSIYREYNEELGDTGSSPESILTGKSFPVGKLFIAETVDGQVKYGCEKRDVVQITDIFFDYLRYENGHSGIGICLDNYTDSHYIAFSTDWNMSDLYDVDISFFIQPWEDTYASMLDYDFGRPSTMSIPNGKETKKTIPVESTDVGANLPSGWLKSNYHSWNRIQTVDSFKSNCGIDLSNEVRNNLKGKQWVLQFYESDYSVFRMGQTATVNYTKVTNETILRLHFKSNGNVYNLGAVSDMGYSDDKSGNKDKSLWDYFIEFCKWLESVTGLHYVVWAIILIAVPCGAVLGILSIFIAPLRFVLGKIFEGIGYGIYYVGYAIVWLVSRPFVGIKALIDKLRGN